MEALVTTEAGAVDVGSVVQVGGTDALISQINRQESNTDFVRASLILRQGDDTTVIHSLDEIQGNN